MRAVSFFIYLLICCAFSLTAQADVPTIVKEAGTLVEQAHEQVQKNQHAEAAFNFIQAAALFTEVGREAQAKGEYLNAATAYETGGDAALEEDQPLEAINFFTKAVEQFRNAGTHQGKSVTNKRRQTLERLFTYHATGTGQTTGHIAELSITNKSSASVSVAAQVIYIPAYNGYQSYVARIPAGITIPAKGTHQLPIIGFCTDAHAPPVPSGMTMPSVEQWVPVQSFVSQEEALSIPDELPILPMVALPAFRLAEVGILGITPGFSPLNAKQAIVTYPNTSSPIGGTFAVHDHPLLIAPLFTAFVQQIEAAALALQQASALDTPYHYDLLKEREAIIQHTVWIVTSNLAGVPYTREDFEKNIYRQFQQNTGTSPENLPPAQKEQMENGINDFWVAFHATGVMGKVLKE